MGNGSVSAVLPIQNLLARNETYLLSLTVSTGEKELHYYTRIMWPDNAYASDMVRLARRFTRKSDWTIIGKRFGILSGNQ